MRLVIVVVLTVRRTVEADGPEVGLPVGAEEGAWVVRLGAAQTMRAASKASNTTQHGNCKVARVRTAIAL